ncbi:MAG: penicillin-binding protein activator LpoB [Victivallales bacterium]|nr:penicillin-binding protein activator LpoB [Victivallales bacterium]
MMNLKTLALAAVLSLVFCGCESVEMVDTEHDRGPAVAGIDYRDFDATAQNMIASMLETGCLNKPDGGRYVIAISRIKNDTTRDFDTDQLMKTIRVELLRSGKAAITTAVGINGPEDAMSKMSRELRADAEFNQNTIAGQGQMIAPDLSISGKILEQKLRITSSKTQIEYYFQLSLTDLKTGVAIWEDQQKIIKRQRR